VGETRWSANTRLGGFVRKRRNGRVLLETAKPIIEAEKSSEERSPRALEAEKGFQGR
jgi:hypothetical protein